MNDEHFEQHLQGQPLRPIPPAWRADILAAASTATPRPPEREADRARFWWRSLLWPSPVAWAGVAAAWLLIVGLNHLTPGPTSTLAVSPGMGGFNLQTTLAMQHLFETEQVENPKSHETEPRKPAPRPQPRSSRVAPQRIFCA
jgi:hypothetical protein